MAAISKACAPPRLPISARSRGGSRSARRRCWWRCRNRRKLRRPDRSPAGARGRARPRARPHRRGTASCQRDEIERAKAEPVPKERKPMPMLAPHAADEAVAAAPGRARSSGSPSTAVCRRALEELARERAPSARTRHVGRDPRRSTTRPARCWRASPRQTISTSAAPARST